MYKFLKEHLRPWHIISEGTELDVGKIYDHTRFLLIEGQLSYDNGKIRLGFNYSGGGDGIDQYMWNVLRWIALRAGRVRLWEDLGKRVPYIVYDGDEAWPVLLRSEWEDKVPDRHKRALVNEDGFKPAYRWWENIDPARSARPLPQERKDELERVLALSDDLGSTELARLSKEWLHFVRAIVTQSTVGGE